MHSSVCYLTDSRNMRVTTPKENVVIESKPESVEDAVAAVTGGVEAAAPKKSVPAKKKGAKKAVKKPAKKAVKKAAKKAVKKAVKAKKA